MEVIETARRGGGGGANEGSVIIHTCHSSLFTYTNTNTQTPIYTNTNTPLFSLSLIV